jgi:hypothetical protein
MKFQKKHCNALTTVFIRTILIVISGFTVLAGCQTTLQIQSPYCSVEWAKYGQYKANLHTHTMVSDGWMNPQTVVEKYRERDYRILSITDHRSVTYPWQEFSKFAISGKTDQRIKYEILKPQEDKPINRSDVEFKDVNPSDVGMIDIQGSELWFRKHELNCFFNNYSGPDSEGFLDTIAAKGGIAVLNHPGRYKLPALWYIDLYKHYNQLVGIEVFNCGNRYPNDRQLWDSILTVMAPSRPVWGFSNDDMHSLRDFGRNWNVFLLPELNKQEVRQAMENGTFYFVYAPDGHNDSKAPVIESIKVNQRKGKIEINASGNDSIVWIAGGKKIMRGNQFVLKKSKGDISYVRAELYGVDDIIVCTQPFFIEKPK